MFQSWRHRIGLSNLKIAVMVPLAVCISLLATGTIYTIQKRHQQEDWQAVHQLTQTAETLFQMAVEKDGHMMASTLRAIRDIEVLKKQFLVRNREALYKSSAKLFQSLRQNFDITHFYFSGPDRVNFLRVHQPLRHGDTISRQTTLIAERDGKPARGLELGPLGTFTLRVVIPWRSDGRVIGYLELGKEIDNIIDEVGSLTNVGTYAFVPKRYIDRNRWEEGMRMLGRTPSWGRFGEVVLTSEVGEKVPDEFIGLVNKGFLEAGKLKNEYRWGDRYMRLVTIQVANVVGKTRSHLVLIKDITAIHEHDEALIRQTIILSLIVAIGLMLLFWFIVAWGERRLGQKEQQLQSNLTNQRIVAGILRAALYGFSLKEVMQYSLDLILSSHEFKIESRGCIFLVDESGEQLEMVAQTGLAEPLLEACARVPFGHCLCGRAARDGALLHTGCLDERHEVRYDGIRPHGHYCAPIQAGSKVYGLLNLYLSEGHPYSKEEERFISSVTDALAGVIQRYRAEDELERQQVLFEAVFRDVPDAMALTNIQRELIDCNPAMSRIFGYERGDVLGQSTLMLYQSEEDFERQGRLRFNLNAEERLEPYVVYYRRKNGSVFPGETVGTAIKDRSGCTIAFLGVIRDITDRLEAQLTLQRSHDELEKRVDERTRKLREEIAEHHKTEASLAESRQQARALLESAGEGIYGVDKEGLTTFINPAAAQMLGYGLDELIGRSMHECIHHTKSDGSPYPKEQCPMSSTLSDGKTHRINNEMLWRKDGTGFPVDYTSNPIMQSGAVVGSVITFRDITARLENEKLLRVAKEEAEAANLAKSHFLATMSHELRTPLNAIIGYSELLCDEAKDQGQEELVPDLERITASGRHLYALINDVLDLSKIEAGRMELLAEPFDVADMVREVTASVQHLVMKNDNQLDLEIGEIEGVMVGDQTKVRQILFNLLSNAGKFTKQGRVSLDIQQERIASWKWIVFRISDTGIGISRDQFDLIFEAFRQGDGSASREYEGTGLGLAVSKRLCEMMGGMIEVESDQGAGAVFTVRLPQTPEKESGSDHV